MPKTNPYRPFVPNPAQMARWPGVSGNDVNGLDETERRSPRTVYWAPDPADIAHGPLQNWFLRSDVESLAQIVLQNTIILGKH